MPDPLTVLGLLLKDVPAVTGASKNVFDLFKGAWELLQRDHVDRPALAQQLTVLYKAFSDLQMHLDEVTRQAAADKTRLEGRINELTHWADVGKDFRFGDGVYWREGAPYCPVCWEQEKRPTRLDGPWRTLWAYNMENWGCPFHHSTYQTLNRP
jgi:hypothetical protein